GFAYVIGGVLLWRGHHLALPVALAILVATAAVFAAFGWRAATGGAYEMRTVGAMTLRTAFWAAMAMIAWTTPRVGRAACSESLSPSSGRSWPLPRRPQHRPQPLAPGARARQTIPG